MLCYMDNGCGGPCLGCQVPCCNPKRPRACQKIQKCNICPPCGYPIPSLGCCDPNASFGCPSSGYPNNPCEPHPCYPPHCRRVKKCAEWPACPCGRPCYRPLGPPKVCYKSQCCPPLPDCPLPKAWPLPCYPRLFPGCKYTPPTCCRKIYYEGPAVIVRDVTWCKPNCAAKCCA